MASTSLSSRAPTHIAHGSWVAKIVASARRTAPELAGGLAEHHDDGVGGRIVRLLDPIVGPDDHRLVDDGDRGVRALAALHRRPRLGQCLAHEELVVHAAMLADGLSRPFGAALGPNRNRPTPRPER